MHAVKRNSGSERCWDTKTSLAGTSHAIASTFARKGYFSSGVIAEIFLEVFLEVFIGYMQQLPLYILRIYIVL